MWQPQANGSLLNPQSGKVLGALGGAYANGTQLHVSQFVGAHSQLWTVNA
ncbi:hypothetical protein ACWKSP_18245 [Micromonosporaceae bacterium Da 78-11]